MTSYQTFLDAAKKFALDAATLIKTHGENQYSATSKSSINDMVTDVDKAAEAFLINSICDQFPNDSILSEEAGSISGSSGISWVIDPIDGTTNFIYGFPSYSVSIGVQYGENTVAAAICSVPDNSLYWAGIGIGAFKGSGEIHVRKKVPIENSLIATGFGYSAVRRVAQAKYLAHIIGEVRDIRRGGAASLDLCYVAEGRLDGYYETGLWPWDYAAATLLVREAGGTVAGPDGQIPTQDLTVAASNPELASFLRERALPFLPFPDS